MSKESSSKNKKADKQVKAVAKNLRVAPRKLNLVAQAIRGLAAQAALAQLTFSRRRIAKDVKKVVQSAIANAENNHQLDVDRLYIEEASVGRGLVMKRMHARAKGRGVRVEKFLSHLTVVVSEREGRA
ncbi:MAG: 50S ribosomal protein L22 [Alphaproteobacteria bacterium]|nr:50S ribosomal protein L22 [Alphaproteobacteria bacterium]